MGNEEWGMGNIGRTIKASDTLKHQPTVWTVPNACAQLYQPGSGQSRSQSPRAFWSAPRRADQKARGLWEREWAVAATFSSPETALLLVSTKNRDLWSSPTMEVRDSRTSRHSVHAQSQV